MGLRQLVDRMGPYHMVFCVDDWITTEDMMTTYTNEFYATRDRSTRYAAETILGLALNQIPPVKSAVDIGCGVGTWLNVLTEKHDVTEVHGLDGPWVPRGSLAIPQACFHEAEFDKHIPDSVGQRYDLAISLEVAEHIPERNAEAFIVYLIQLSDTVLFSAAIPGQGGTGHVNEQWPSYWSELFGRYGYRCFDEIRPQIWTDENIPFWYRQNVLMFERSTIRGASTPLSLVHPELYLAHAKPGIKGSVQKLREAFDDYVGKS